MRVNPKELAKIIKNAKKEELKDILRRVFSFKENIDTFSLFFFPHVVTNKIPSFHKNLYEKLFKEGNDAFAAPRGHAKTTITGLIFIIFNIANRMEKYIIYVSQNHIKTTQFITPIRDEFLNNDLLNSVYPECVYEASKDEYGKNRQDCFDINNIRLEAVSFEKNLRGFKYKNIRPTLIIGDDIEDDARVLNPELRERDSEKLNKVIIPSLDINGRFKFIGTILHQNSLLMKKIKQYDGLIFRACDNDLKNVLWPDRFTKKKLQKIKKDIGSTAFQQEYLNDPSMTQDSIIRREWVIQCFREDLSYKEVQKRAIKNKFKLKTEGTDFAFSDRITADNSAFVSVGEKDDFCYVFDCQIKHGLSVNEQLRFLRDELHSKYKYDMIGLEENSIKAVSKDLGTYKLPLTLFWTSASDPSVKKAAYKDYDYLGKRHTVGKFNLIMRLGTAFENKRIILPYKTDEDKQISDRILAECCSYALSDGKLVEAGIHPDIPIALGYALELIDNIKKVYFDFGGDK